MTPMSSLFNGFSTLMHSALRTKQTAHHAATKASLGAKHCSYKQLFSFFSNTLNK